MHLRTKLSTAAIFAVLLSTIPAIAQNQPWNPPNAWTPLNDGTWSEILWNNGSQYGTPGTTDTIRINGGIEVTDNASVHTGDVSVFGGGKLNLRPLEVNLDRVPLRTGTINVYGAGSEWITSGALRFDRESGKDQSFIVAGGGKMQTYSTRFGITGGDYAAAIVVGAGSQLIQQAQLAVGYTGNAGLSIHDQATVTAQNAHIGMQAGSNGTIGVVGDGSTFNSGVLLTVGKQGTGTLEISRGSFVTAKAIVIGGQADDGIGAKGTGTVTVGTNGGTIQAPTTSVLSATDGAIQIGNGGKGMLTVESGGKISSTSPVLLGSNNGWGTLRISNKLLTHQAIIDASEIRGEGGRAEVHFLGIGNASLASDITGNIAVNIFGSSVTLTGNNTYTGGTTISGSNSSLAVTNANQVGTGTIRVGGILYSSVNLDNRIELLGGKYIRAMEEGTDLSMTTQSAQTGGVATTAEILAGTQSNTSEVDVNFGLSSPAANDDIRISDVFSIDGTGDSVFVLELAVDNIQEGAFLSWLHEGAWINAIDGNIGNTDYALEQFQGSYADFALLNGNNLSEQIGAWGIYDAGVWAVINHNSDFSIVAPIPEPSTYALILGGAFALHMIRRKKK